MQLKFEYKNDKRQKPQSMPFSRLFCLISFALDFNRFDFQFFISYNDFPILVAGSLSSGFFFTFYSIFRCFSVNKLSKYISQNHHESSVSKLQQNMTLYFPSHPFFIFFCVNLPLIIYLNGSL